MRTRPLGPALIAEAVGTFALVFLGCGALAVGNVTTAGVAAAFGLAIMTMIYAFGHVSGGHFNPAVTAAFAVGRHFPASRVVPYWLAQILGAIAGAAVLGLTLGDAVGRAVTRSSGTAGQAIVWEAVLTFLLMLVIAAVATDTRVAGQGAAIAIGGAVAMGALVGGPVSGASMNPARSLGPALVSGKFDDLWIYLVAPPVGAIVGVLVYRYIRQTRAPTADC